MKKQTVQIAEKFLESDLPQSIDEGLTKIRIGQSAAKASFKEECSTTKSSESYMYHYIVYKTTNLINNKIYIGVHRTRIDKYDGYIGCGIYSENSKPNNFKGFCGAVKKYGYQNFKRETLFTYPDTEEGKINAYKKEAELVNRDFLKRNDVYNICLGGKVPSSVWEKQINQYDLDGNYIKTWDSISQASEITPTSTIQYCCQNETYSKDFQWRYYVGNTNNIAPAKLRTKVVYQFDLQGNFITYYKSVNEAARQTQIPVQSISRVCLGKTAQAGGFYWNYKKRFEFDPKKICKTAVACYTNEGCFIKSFDSLTSAAKEYNVSPTTIICCIKGRQKHCAKVRWRYFYGNTSNITSLKTKI